MMGKLRYYIAHDTGLQVSVGAPDATPIGEFFAGRVVDHVLGSSQRPERVFAAVDGDGGYRTLDGGKTWQKILDDEVRQFAIDPHDDKIVYAGLSPVRLLRSEDGGMTWERLDALTALPADVQKKWDTPDSIRGKDFPHVRDILIHPEDASAYMTGQLLDIDGGLTFL
jgi:hypothetical protein